MDFSFWIVASSVPIIKVPAGTQTCSIPFGSDRTCPAVGWETELGVGVYEGIEVNFGAHAESVRIRLTMIGRFRFIKFSFQGRRVDGPDQSDNWRNILFLN
jgi:hypothetical protein